MKILLRIYPLQTLNSVTFNLIETVINGRSEYPIDELWIRLNWWLYLDNVVEYLDNTIALVIVISNPLISSEAATILMIMCSPTICDMYGYLLIVGGAPTFIVICVF